MTNPIGLLDTSVVVDLQILNLKSLPDSGTISAVTLAELSAGPAATKDPTIKARRQLQIQLAESQFSVLPFDARAARMYALLYQAIHAKGTKTRGGRALDLMIAATALAHDLPLYTRNPKDFSNLRDLVTVVGV
jgi:predicted nucleic acid-binding protein